MGLAEISRLFVRLDLDSAGFRAGLAQAVSQTNAAAGTMEAGSKRIAGGFNGVSTSLTGVGATAESTSKRMVGSFENVAKSLAGIGASAVKAGALVAGIGAALSIKSASSYQDTLTRINALTNTSAADTKKLGDAILEMSKRMPKSPGELGEAAYFALSSGIDSVDEALKVVEMSAKAAVAGLGSTKDVVDIVTAAINAYGPANLTAAQAVDTLVATVREGKGEPAQMATSLGTLLPIAAALKVSFPEVGAVFASLTNELGGTGGAFMATTQFKGILTQLISPSDDAKKALAETGAFAGKTSTEFTKATASAEDVASASRALAADQNALSLAQRRLADDTKKYGANSVQVQSAQLAVTRATNTLRDAQAKLAKEQGNSTGKAVVTSDAFAELRDEIQSKGLIPTLQKLRDAFHGNLEELGRIFPDQRGFIGFLSAIESQGAKTAEIQKRIAAATGLTDEAFKKTSANFSFQAGLLKNLFNVELIKLGTAILPTVTRGVESLIKALNKLILAFKIGFSPQEGIKGLRDEMALLGSGAIVQGFVRLGAAVRVSIGLLVRAFNSLKGPISAVASFLGKGALAGGLIAIGVAAAGIIGPLAASAAPFIAVGVALLLVGRAIQPLLRSLPELFRLFLLGARGGQIGGQFSTMQKAAFALGQFFTSTLVPAFRDAEQAVHLFFLALQGGSAGGSLSSLQQTFLNLGTQVRQTWLADIQPALVAFHDIIRTVVAFIIEHWGTISPIFAIVAADVKEKVGGMLEVFQGVIEIVSGVIQGVDDAIHGRWSQVWDDFKLVVSGAVDVVIGYFRNQFGLLGDIMYEQGKKAGESLVSGLKDGLGALGGSLLKSAINLGGAIGPIPSHKTGLDYVPHDNYLANLHKGERVLTADEARAFTKGQAMGDDAQTLEAAISSVVNRWSQPAMRSGEMKAEISGLYGFANGQQTADEWNTAPIGSAARAMGRDRAKAALAAVQQWSRGIQEGMRQGGSQQQQSNNQTYGMHSDAQLERIGLYRGWPDNSPGANAAAYGGPLGPYGGYFDNSGKWVPVTQAYLAAHGMKDGAWSTKEGPAYLHDKEMVVPAKFAEVLRGLSRGMGHLMPGPVNYNVPAFSAGGAFGRSSGGTPGWAGGDQNVTVVLDGETIYRSVKRRLPPEDRPMGRL